MDRAPGPLPLDEALATGRAIARVLDHTLVLEAIAAQLALGIENARVYREIARLKERLELENVYLKEELATHAFPARSSLTSKLKKLGISRPI